MRFGGATEAGRMQRPTSDDNRRGLTRGGEAPEALTGIPGLDEATRGGRPRGRPTLGCGDVDLALTVGSTWHGTNVQLVAARSPSITFLLSGLITTTTHQGAHDVRSLNEDQRAVSENRSACHRLDS